MEKLPSFIWINIRLDEFNHLLFSTCLVINYKLYLLILEKIIKSPARLVEICSALDAELNEEEKYKLGKLKLGKYGDYAYLFENINHYRCIPVGIAMYGDQTRPKFGCKLWGTKTESIIERPVATKYIIEFVDELIRAEQIEQIKEISADMQELFIEFGKFKFDLSSMLNSKAKYSVDEGQWGQNLITIPRLQEICGRELNIAILIELIISYINKVCGVEINIKNYEGELLAKYKELEDYRRLVGFLRDELLVPILTACGRLEMKDSIRGEIIKLCNSKCSEYIPSLLNYDTPKKLLADPDDIYMKQYEGGNVVINIVGHELMFDQKPWFGQEFEYDGNTYTNPFVYGATYTMTEFVNLLLILSILGQWQIYRTIIKTRHSKGIDENHPISVLLKKTEIKSLLKKDNIEKVLKYRSVFMLCM